MDFDQLLDRFWGYDCEVTQYDNLFVFINYRTRERVYFHNSLPNDIHNFIDKHNPILMGYNNNGYDKFILKGVMNGCSPEEVKLINDHIINGGNGWELGLGRFKLPTQVDLLNCIIPRKSLKELEGNLRMNITESTVSFDIDHKWTEQEFKEMLYYCTCDVEALFPIFEMLMTRFKSKFIIAKLGNMDPEYAISLTDANLTAVLLKAERQEHDDYFKYEYPSVVDKSKIPQVVLDYIDDLIEHNDLNYKIEAPCVEFGDVEVQLGIGGLHGFKKEGVFMYDRGDNIQCE